MEISITFVMNLIAKYFPINCQQAVFSFANLVFPLITALVPYYNNFMISAGLSPFSCYGFLNVLGFIALFWLKKKDICIVT